MASKGCFFFFLIETRDAVGLRFSPVAGTWPGEVSKLSGEKEKQGNPKVRVVPVSLGGTSVCSRQCLERQFIQTTWFAFSTSF